MPDQIDRIDWPDLDDYPQARDAVALLTFDYDRVAVDRLPPMGALQWQVECLRRDECKRCEGDGQEPDERRERCRSCGGTGRVKFGPLRLVKVLIVHSDGRIRQKEQT